MRKIYWVLFSILFISCEEQEKKGVNLKEQFDFIDKITGVDNWKSIDGNDTTYLYFSRIGDQKINVYYFKIEKGDSVFTKLCPIEAKYDSIKWNWGNRQWYLVSANDSAMEWGVPGINVHYVFKKLDRMHISFLSPTGADTLSKTLPLATFLVRAKYDYEHGTSYIDSNLVPPGDKKRN